MEKYSIAPYSLVARVDLKFSNTVLLDNCYSFFHFFLQNRICPIIDRRQECFGAVFVIPPYTVTFYFVTPGFPKYPFKSSSKCFLRSMSPSVAKIKKRDLYSHSLTTILHFKVWWAIIFFLTSVVYFAFGYAKLAKPLFNLRFACINSFILAHTFILWMVASCIYPS